MHELIVANMRQRPARTMACMLGVALGVLLILLTLGLADGMMQSSARRESQVGAELMFQPPGSYGVGLSSTPLALPVAYAAAVRTTQGVRATTPVGRYVRAGAGGLGFELIEGVVFEPHATYDSYPQVTGIRVAEGRPPRGDREILIDRVRAHDHDIVVGSSVELLGQTFTVSGVFEPEVGARLKMPLSALQALLGNPDRCSWLLVATDDPANQVEVAARLDQRFPGNQVIFTRDIPGFFAHSLPSLTVFLNVVVGLATIVSGLVVLLAMYTAVTERAREIGILKSLGLSKRRVIGLIVCEAFVLGVLGIVLGIGITMAAREGIIRQTSLLIDIEPTGLILASTVALVAAVTGALYPAVVAARRDPVEALAYE